MPVTITFALPDALAARLAAALRAHYPAVAPAGVSDEQAIRRVAAWLLAGVMSSHEEAVVDAAKAQAVNTAVTDRDVSTRAARRDAWLAVRSAVPDLPESPDEGAAPATPVTRR